MATAGPFGEKKAKLLVAAVDFGTTYSGYAFSLKHDYTKDPLKISVNQAWTAGSMALTSYKAPTVVLFNERKEFHSFGYEAEDMYSELAMDGEHHNWYFFKRFKMRLHKEKVLRDMSIDDAKGRSLPAMLVFQEVIRYLKGHMLETLKKRGTMIENKDIHWVLTVPAIWRDAAKQFMRESACKAEIEGGQLTVALEPEAASLFCQLLPTDKVSSTIGTSFAVASAGSKYMVIDLGGGTADITVHERQEDGGLRELHKASGGAWGGTRVDEEFDQLLIKIIGAPVLTKFKEEYTADYLDLMRELEVKKRTIKPSSKGKITLKVPVKLAETYEDETEEKVAEAIAGSTYQGKLTWASDKMRLDAEVFKGLFKHCIEKIIEHIKDLLCNDNVSGTKTLLMVGGFSDSEMMQAAVKNAFPACNVIIPEEAGLCVLKGAVIFGHRPVSITSRMSRYTYGINISPPYDKDNHPPSRKVTVGGVDRCQNVFRRYIQEGEAMRVGEARTGRHITLSDHQTEMVLNIYASPKRDPQFVDEDESECLGQVVVKLPDKDDKIRVEVSMKFGETELAVEAEELSTNNKYTSYFDFL
ncbi:heat shock 70 kDa protein 12A-like [Mya arenaria]|uniref:heat shock 70 kDa protein 12A-like n=1 Tax=Mya arenaria TaxID=6604 RepID=UPI0022E7E28F|nr:heat shock 70 kDa protein 12A-like [Mya arenaria]